MTPSRQYRTPLGLKIDLAVTPSGQLAVLNANDFSTWTIEEFPITASGSVTPTSTITGPGGADAFALDNAGNFYVEYSDTRNELVNVYGAGASGPATPMRSITLDGITASSDIAVH